MSDFIAQTALIIEDEAQIRRFVRAALEEERWNIVEADSIKRGLIDAGTRKPDLIILDLGLPDGDGIDFIRDVRQWSAIPIIVLSARVNETDKIAALDAGADDYLTKPFGTGELLARVRATLRRQRPATQSDNGVVQFGDVIVNLHERQISKAGAAIHLTPIEYRLLTALLSNAGRVLTTTQLLKEVWGPGYAQSPHYVRVYMGHLRQKLEDDPTRPRYLLTETAVGYRIVLV
jgi:two-component system, OmpR family, KDP operon response regulator KdpE